MWHIALPRKPTRNQSKAVNKLILGDNLESLKLIDNDTIDLIYLDPPFFSNRNYNAETGFKPSVIIDKEGKQQHKIKPGLHNIAVKVVDNEGLDNIEIIKLKVNGTVERS